MSHHSLPVTGVGVAALGATLGPSAVVVGAVVLILVSILTLTARR